MKTIKGIDSGKNDLRIWKIAVYISIVLGIANTGIVAVLAVQIHDYRIQNNSTTSTLVNLQPISITGTLITPPQSYSDAPPILQSQPFGVRLTNINVPLNSSELSVINNASDSFFETAAQMYINRSLTIPIGATVYSAPLLSINQKPSVIYLGAISCPFCAENRWAMALALSRFGGFQELFKGYSAIGDGDIPTIYWAPAEYNATSGAVEFGNFFVGKYATFVSIEYSSPITAAFQMQPLQYFQQQAQATGNSIYENASKIIISLNNYEGTPYTIWGKFSVPSADASNYGDPAANSTTTLPMASLTHDQILQKLARPTTNFAWNEYAAADYYIALLCASTSVSPFAAVCSLPFVSTMASEARG